MTIKIDKVAVQNEDLSPKVLTAATFLHGKSLPRGYTLRERYVYDYEFELILYSEGSMVIDDIKYDIKEGDILFRKPGQYTQGTMPYSCYLVCVDMLNNTLKSSKDYYIYDEQVFQNYCVNPILDGIPTIFHSINIEKSIHIFDSILKEFITPTPSSHLSLKANILNLICYLYQDSNDPFINTPIHLSHHFSSLKDVVEYIENNLQNKMVLSDFSKIANLSPSHFHRIFTKTVGLTPHDFILKCKLDKAKKLLARTSMTISEISMQCGFENIPYFSYVFKKSTSLTPSEFRRNHGYL